MLRLPTSLACLLILTATAPARAEGDAPPPPVTTEPAPEKTGEKPAEKVDSQTGTSDATEAKSPASPAPVEAAPVSGEAAPAPAEAAPASVEAAPAPAEAAPAPVEAAPVEATPVAPTPVIAPAPVPAAPASEATPAPASTPATNVVPLPIKAPNRNNEVAIELGWNAPVGIGFRYLRSLGDNGWAIGGGWSPATLWGMKWAVLVRHQSSFESGFFQQLSVGFTAGGGTTTEQIQLTGRSETIALVRTEGRTVDGVLGYRWPIASWGIEAFAGYSLRLRGTALQNLEQTQVTVNDATRSALWITQPGGISLGLAIGHRF